MNIVLQSTIVYKHSITIIVNRLDEAFPISNEVKQLLAQADQLGRGRLAMSSVRTSFLLLCFVTLCFMSACRTTESQIQQYSPTLLERATPVGQQDVQIPATPTPPGRAAKLQWYLLTAAILAVVVVVFDSDPGEKKRYSARRTSTKRKKKRG